MYAPMNTELVCVRVYVCARFCLHVSVCVCHGGERIEFVYVFACTPKCCTEAIVRPLTLSKSIANKGKYWLAADDLNAEAEGHVFGICRHHTHTSCTHSRSYTHPYRHPLSCTVHVCETVCPTDRVRVYLCNARSLVTAGIPYVLWSDSRAGGFVRLSDGYLINSVTMLSAFLWRLS